MIKITLEFLRKKDACQEYLDWFSAQSESDLNIILQKLISEKKYTWANWLLTRGLAPANAVKYAVFAAETVLAIFEKKYPDDIRPRAALATAKKYLDNPDAYAANAAYAASAYTHADSAYTHADSAAQAANAAYAAAYAADSVAYANSADQAAQAAYTAAANAADSVAYANSADQTDDSEYGYNSWEKTYNEFLNYGLTLLAR